MKVIEQLNKEEFPLTWVNLEYFPESNGIKKEIYLSNESDKVEDLIHLFMDLFENVKNDIVVYNNSWWDYCIDTWNPVKNSYDYELGGKSTESRNYLSMLKESDITMGYSGNCRCIDWHTFLVIILNCIVKHTAPYSPVFYNERDNYFFYFHHTCSIGLYYQEPTQIIQKLLNKASQNYVVR